MRTVRQGVAVLAATLALVVSGQTAASAGVQWAVDPWGQVCSTPYGVCDHGAEGGAVVWGQRTAEVSGAVWDQDTDPSTYTTVYFDAFAGANKIDSTTRTQNGGDEDRPFRFDIGDPNLVGGIDRVRIQVCVHFPDWPYKECGGQLNLNRD